MRTDQVSDQPIACTKCVVVKVREHEIVTLHLPGKSWDRNAAILRSKSRLTFCKCTVCPFLLGNISNDRKETLVGAPNGSVFVKALMAVDRHCVFRSRRFSGFFRLSERVLDAVDHFRWQNLPHVSAQKIVRWNQKQTWVLCMVIKIRAVLALDEHQVWQRRKDRCVPFFTLNQRFVNKFPDLMFIQSEDGTYLDYHAQDPSLLLVPP